MRTIGLFFVWVAAVFAADPAPATHDFLPAGAVDFHAVIAAPPAEDSIAGRADHEIARMLEANRSPEQVALAGHYAKFSVFTLLADVLGESCTAANLPRTAAFFDQVYAESSPVILAAKSNWNRLRPYVFDPDLHPAVARPSTTSYPSGHAFMSSLDTVLLSAALPEHAAAWAKEAQLVRWSRLYGGAHYPNDVVAGRILGEAVAQVMLRSPKLRQALREIRAEIMGHRLKQAAG